MLATQHFYAEKTPLAPAVALPVHSMLNLAAMFVFRVMSIHVVCSKGANAWENKYPANTVCDLLLMLKVRKLYKLLDEDEKEVSNTDNTLQKPSLGKP